MTSQQFIDSIQKVEDLEKHYQFIKSLVNSDNQKLIRIFDLIPKNFGSYNWQLKAGYEKIINTVCRNSDRNLIKIASIIFGKTERQLDKLKIASMLSSYHTSEILINELILNKNDELLNLIIHELVSRGTDLRKNEHHDYLKTINEKSEFNLLSLFPLKQELKNTFLNYSENATSWHHSFGFAWEDVSQNIEHIEEFNKLATVKCVEEIIEAIDHWEKDSGGTSIGYKGEMNGFNSIELFIKNIPDFSGSERLSINNLDSTRAFQNMFDASSKGAAYSDGNMGAYGRLKAWRSIHRMMSNQEMESNEITSELMNEFDWFEFNTDDFFINEWCDFGLICMNNEKSEFGLIAGTDTD